LTRTFSADASVGLEKVRAKRDVGDARWSSANMSNAKRRGAGSEVASARARNAHGCPRQRSPDDAGHRWRSKRAEVFLFVVIF